MPKRRGVQMLYTPGGGETGKSSYPFIVLGCGINQKRITSGGNSSASANVPFVSDEDTYLGMIV